MSSPDVLMGEDGPHAAEPETHQPFSLRENIEQLNSIDRSIVELMNHTATALNALSSPSVGTTASPDGAENSKIDAPSQKESFRLATNSFLRTLQGIDVRMKRHVLALEEAGIVNLSNAPRQDAGRTSKSSLQPNGVGSVGNLDVGWLNSRSSKIERDMEAEIWKDARELLERESDELKSSWRQD